MTNSVNSYVVGKKSAKLKSWEHPENLLVEKAKSLVSGVFLSFVFCFIVWNFSSHERRHQVCS